MTRASATRACPPSSAASTRAAFASTARRAPHRGCGCRGPRPVPDLPGEDTGRPPLVDDAGRVIHSGRYPDRIYESFEAIPPAVVSALLFVEDRQLLDASRPYLNPTINWGRLARAVVVDARARFGSDARVIGASTLATQIEKFRHSPEGRTASAREKLRQMLSASLRAYRDGAGARLPLVAASWSTTSTRCRSPPRPATARSTGSDDGLRAWFGADLAAANRALADESASPTRARPRVQADPRASSSSARRPSYYLVEDRRALEDFTDSYLRLMRDAGVIDGSLRDAALAERLDVPDPAPSVGRLHRAQGREPRPRPAVEPARRPLALRPRSARSHRAEHALTSCAGVGDPAPALAARARHRAGPRPQGAPSPRRPRRPGAGDLQLHPLRETAERQPRARADRQLRPAVRHQCGGAPRSRLHGQAPHAHQLSRGGRRRSTPGSRRSAPTSSAPIEVHRRDQLTAWAVEYLGRARDSGSRRCSKPRWSGATPRTPGRASSTGGGPPDLPQLRAARTTRGSCRCARASATRSTWCSSG